MSHNNNLCVIGVLYDVNIVTDVQAEVVGENAVQQGSQRCDLAADTPDSRPGQALPLVRRAESDMLVVV